MALNASYAFLAASFSDLLTGAGFAILLAKFSASLPLNTGVSLIGRAISVLLLLVIILQRYNKFLIYRVVHSRFIAILIAYGANPGIRKRPLIPRPAMDATAVGNAE